MEIRKKRNELIDFMMMPKLLDKTVKTQVAKRMIVESILLLINSRYHVEMHSFSSMLMSF